jgi:hypothetical protein
VRKKVERREREKGPPPKKKLEKGNFFNFFSSHLEHRDEADIERRNVVAPGGPSGKHGGNQPPGVGPLQGEEARVRADLLGDLA